MKRFFFVLSLVAISLAVVLPVLAYSSLGKATAFVNDYTNTLSSDQIANLNQKIEAFKEETSNEIAVAIISDLNGDTIENYAVKLFEEWQIGQADVDNGILLLISLNDRMMRIEVGYGLEGALPDAYSYQIINNILKPAFRQNDYYGGIDKAISSIMSATFGEYTNFNSSNVNKANNIGGDVIIFLIFFAFSILNYLYRFLAKSKSWWQGGVIGLVLGIIISLIFSVTLVFFIIIPLALAIFGLISDYLLSRVLPKPKEINRKGGGFWFLGGGGGGSGGFGGGGFGGFGGGSSGGGGASGSW